MNTYLKSSKIFNLALAAGLSLALLGCSKSPDKETPEPTPNEQHQYHIIVNAGSEAAGYGNYALEVDDLMKDTIISPLNSGIDFSANTFGMFFNNGYYYHVNDGGAIVKSGIVDGKLTEIDNVADAGWPEKTYFKSDDELVMNAYGTIVHIDVSDMSITSKKDISLPTPTYKVYNDKGEETWFGIDRTAFMTLKEDKLYIGYFFTYYEPTYTKTDTARIYRLDYPSLENPTILTDTRAGTVNGSTCFDDEGNMYFPTNSWLGFNAGHKANGRAIMRIKKGEDTIDQDYIFRVGDDDFEIGSLKTIAGSIAVNDRKQVLDLKNKSVLTDLSQRGIGEPEFGVQLVENNKLYQVYKTEDAKFFVYEYDPATNQLKKGLQIDGGVAHIDSMYKIK